MKITQAQGNGQGQCALCKKRGKWNVQWMCFLYKVESKDGVYCKHCADEFRIQNAIDNRMGPYTDQSEWKFYNKAIEKYPNVLYTHMADMIASKLREGRA